MKNRNMLTLISIFFITISFSNTSPSYGQMALIDLINLTNSPAPASEGSVGWYPDGSILAIAKGCDYTAGGPGTGIWSIEPVVGSTPIEIYSVSSPVNLNWPDFSPNGEKLAYVWDVVGGGDIYVIDSEGFGTPVCIACESIMETQPEWSPLGDKIAYTRGIYNNEPINIWTMNPDGSNKQQLTFGKGDTAPEWNHTGTQIAFSRRPGRYEGYNQICTMNDDGSNIIQLTSGNYHNSAPSWSPDGSYIAFVSEKDSDLAPGDLWIMKSDGSEQQRLTDIGGVAFPKWSPTGNVIAFQRHTGINCDIEIYLAYVEVIPVTVHLDIKPGSCPNPLNVKSKGVLPVAIMGDESLDIKNIDIASIRLLGVAPIRSAIEDIGMPNDCWGHGPDGFDDLTLKFKTQEILSAIGEVEDGDEIILEIEGKLFDSTVIAGEDVVLIIKKGKKIKKRLPAGKE